MNMSHQLICHAGLLEQAFEKHTCHADDAQLVADLLAQVRPEKPEQTDVAVKSIQALCYLLSTDETKASQLRGAILQLLSAYNPLSLFLTARHSVFTGFFSEMRRRIAHKILPEAIDKSYLIDLFSIFFTKATDEVWVRAVPDSVWAELIGVMRFDLADPALSLSCRQNLLAAAQVLSYRTAALGLEPELLKNYPGLERHSSPFIMQQAELAEFISAQDVDGKHVDIKHILVMLDQCKAIVAKVRRNSALTGTSIQLTQLLQRILKQIERLEELLTILHCFQHQQSANTVIVPLFKDLVYSECHKNDLHEYWQENIELMAVRVTENASRTGEHYITESRSEYFALMRSAMGAGFIIGLMAMIKLMLAKQHFAPLLEAILFSLNYGIGFMLIHILHFTVATKQPAMTAAVIASTIDNASDGKTKDMHNLVTTVTNTMRSQAVAIFGNVVVAIPMAMLLSWAVFYFTGHHFVTQEKAHHLLLDIHPLSSAAFFYAGIAGVCLFLSGLISGYYDNLAVYNKIPQRLKAVGWLERLLGVERLARVAHYVEHNLGALAGNFYFGCMLGGMGSLGVLLGLPIDIRHISFSSAFVGFASFSLDFMLTWQAVAYATLGLVLIGLGNLIVSFILALYVAMKSRKVHFSDWRLLLRNLGSRLNQHPMEFILPPKDVPVLATEESNKHKGPTV